MKSTAETSNWLGLAFGLARFGLVDAACYRQQRLTNGLGLALGLARCGSVWFGLRSMASAADISKRLGLAFGLARWLRATRDSVGKLAGHIVPRLSRAIPIDV